MYTLTFFWDTKILNPAVRIRTANLTYPKFPSGQFFELTWRKYRKIKKLKKGHECIPKDFFRPKILIPGVRVKTTKLT